MTALHYAVDWNSIDVGNVLLKISNIKINAKNSVSISNLLIPQYILQIFNPLTEIVYGLVHFYK